MTPDEILKSIEGRDLASGTVAETTQVNSSWGSHGRAVRHWLVPITSSGTITSSVWQEPIEAVKLAGKAEWLRVRLDKRKQVY
jgi:hypothetical protein